MVALRRNGLLKDSNSVLNCIIGETEACSMPSPHTHRLVLLQLAMPLHASGSDQVISFASGVVWLTPLTGGLF